MYIGEFRQGISELNLPDTLYFVPDSQLDSFTKHFNKLRKKSIQWGFEEPTMKICPVHFYVKMNIGDEYERTVSVKMHTVICDIAETIKMDDYTLIGILDHYTKMVRVVPGQTLPEEYFGAEEKCDHCTKHRNRKETFIVRHKESGELFQVGRQCLKDFLGIDGKNLLHMVSRYGEFGVFRNISDDIFLNPQGPVAYDTEEVLYATLGIINKWGWTSGAVAQEKFIMSTKEILCDWMFDRPNFKHNHGVIDITPEVKEEAKKMVEWAKELEVEGNEYLYNLKTIATDGIVSSRYFGFLASIPAAYKRATEVKEENTEKKSNQHLGELKKRSVFTDLKVTFTKLIDGYYGTREMVKFEDSIGNELVWFASGYSDLAKGDVVDIKGTVKEHSVWNGRLQTQLSRVKIEKSHNQPEVVNS